MQGKINYQKKLDELILGLSGRKPKLMLHGCCAPCSSYVLEYLRNYFEITLFYYNPNISPESEFIKREEEVRRLISEMPYGEEISFLEAGYDGESFEKAARGLEDVPEGGERCFRCYELRLRKTAEKAKELGCDYFTTTLSISPLKNSQKINEIGERIGEEYGVSHLPSDFKKRDGYKRSIELSKIYGLYRQNYCGCRFSKGKEEENVSNS